MARKHQHKINLVQAIKTTMWIVFLLLATDVYCQEKGSIRVIQPAGLDSLLAISKNNKAYNKIEGYRVQIFMESGNEAVGRAQQVIADFAAIHPNIPTYLSFGQPYYRVRVGNFRTRLEAESQLPNISLRYSKAFIIKENIEPPQLFSVPINPIEP